MSRSASRVGVVHRRLVERLPGDRSPMCGEVSVAKRQIEVRRRERELTGARDLPVAEAVQPPVQVLAVALGEVGRGARPDQLGRVLVIPGSGGMIDGLLEALMLRIPGAGAAMQVGLELRLPAMELRDERLLEEWVVAIGAVGVIQRLHRKLRPSQLTQDPAGSRPRENVVADLASEVLENRGPHQESEAGNRNAREELVPHVVGHEAVIAAELVASIGAPSLSPSESPAR